MRTQPDRAAASGAASVRTGAAAATSPTIAQMRLKSRRAAHLLVSTAAVLAMLTACGPPSNLPHVTMVGDSTLAGMVWYDQAGVTRSQTSCAPPTT